MELQLKRKMCMSINKPIIGSLLLFILSIDLSILRERRKENHADNLCGLSFPDFVIIPHGHSKLYKCPLTTMAQDISFHEISLNRNCCNHKGTCTLVCPYCNQDQLEFSVSFEERISREFLIQENSKHPQFSAVFKNGLKISYLPAVPVLI